ncbi:MULTISPECIES: type I-E CRISPR-associated protein Cas6/Cse3/CasE [unclassified Cobetia]|uniref:type I-E CRISPR-associated protein Cas6/Cse3/CasE n=1 Tax=unclassified Cobetia TaxID=2609414 RepID=UPI002097C0D2|nr:MULTISPECIES: type I-E CRISPR-associated protein Cas6/Cse3/CasE [unclassified Cobetia]MCO7231764.1 type I-E CRISPR-associated protein Cas6/Cse3/CasE [Cobetia sp. Dlab-2-AX]MCO7234920.1 type I-E CRISPR-associated protein Cas6/Cse3/CasE [Cobetia sp. Dlab-2-U]
MYLSRVRVDLNGLSRESLFEIMGGGAYAAHQLLWQLFPEHEGVRPFLFRQEMEESDIGQNKAPKGLPLFYVLSDRQPAASQRLLDVHCKSFEPNLSVGDQLAFRLRANPTVARRVEGAKHSPRSDVLMAAKKLFPAGQRTSESCVQAMDQAARDWLKIRADNGGFRLVMDPEVSGYRQHVIQKPGRRDAIRFSSVDYEGLLEVTDPGRLIETISQGLGRAKAFGCGLLLVRRL